MYGCPAHIVTRTCHWAVVKNPFEGIFHQSIDVAIENQEEDRQKMIHTISKTWRLKNRHREGDRNCWRTDAKWNEKSCKKVKKKI